MQLRVGLLTIASAVVAVVLISEGPRAQTLNFSLFERYLEPLREQAGIPGLSAAILHDGNILWERGTGLRDVEQSHPALPDTPYPIANLTQTMTAALLLDCRDRGELVLEEPIGKFVPAAAAPGTTLRDVVTHAAPGTSAGFRYDAARFSLLARPVEHCGDRPFRKLLALEILDAFAMTDAVPGQDITTTSAELRQMFDEETLARYSRTLARMAVPYKIDRRLRPIRNELPAGGVDGSHGIIASVRDLAKFDQALEGYHLLSAASLNESRINTVRNGVTSPFGIGWFVQVYAGEKIVWHFGLLTDASSSLILKVPGRRLTLILLANSDGLSAPYALHEGDVTTSLFARTFLRLFL